MTSGVSSTRNFSDKYSIPFRAHRRTAVDSVDHKWYQLTRLKLNFANFWKGKAAVVALGYISIESANISNIATRTLCIAYAHPIVARRTEATIITKETGTLLDKNERSVVLISRCLVQIYRRTTLEHAERTEGRYPYYQPPGTEINLLLLSWFFQILTKVPSPVRDVPVATKV